MKQTGDSLPRSELRRHPAWQRRQRWLSGGYWALMLILPLAVLTPLLLGAVHKPAALPKTGDPLLDDLIRFTLDDWRTQPAKFQYSGMLKLEEASLQELQRRYPDDPRVDELYVWNFRRGRADNPDSVLVRHIEAARSEGRRNPGLAQEELICRQRIWRREWLDRQTDKTPISQLTPQQRRTRSEKMAREIEAQHGSERLALMAELRGYMPDNAYPDFMELNTAVSQGDRETAWLLLRQGSSHAQCSVTPEFPATDWQAMLREGTAPGDPMVGLTLAGYESGSFALGLRSSFSELGSDAAARGDLEDLQSLHQALCRVAHCEGVGQSSSRAAINQLDDLANKHLQTALNGRTPPAAVTKLRARIATLQNEYSALGLPPAYQGPGSIFSGPFAWADLLIANYSGQYAVAEMSQRYYSEARTWRSAIQPGGKFFIEIEDLERFDYRTLSWTARGASPAGAP